MDIENCFFIRLLISLKGRFRPFVRASVRPSVRPVLFSKDKYGRFECKKSSNDIINNDTLSDDEVVASHVPRGTCFFHFWGEEELPNWQIVSTKLRMGSKFSLSWSIDEKLDLPPSGFFPNSFFLLCFFFSICCFLALTR